MAGQELASLVLAVDTRPVDAATVSMDKATLAADRLNAATDRLAKAGAAASGSRSTKIVDDERKIEEAFGKEILAIQRNTAAYERMQAQAAKMAFAGIRSPQAVADELRSLAAARDAWEQAGKSAQGYSGAMAQITARTNVLTEGNARARGAIRETAAAMASLAFEAAGAAFLITAVGGALAAPAFFGVSMLKRVEDAQTGIAGILMSMGTLDGKALTFEQSMAASGEYVKKIQEDSLKFGIEMGKLVEVNQAAMSGGLAAMLTLDQIQKVATAGAIAVSSLGLNSQQYVQEVRDLIAGGIQPASSTLARSIGVTDALLKQWKAEGPDKLIGELTTRLQGFMLVADKVRTSTLTGAWDVLQARLALLLSDTEGFGAIKKAVIDLANYIGSIDPITKKFTFNKEALATAQAYWDVLKSLGTVFGSLGSIIAELAWPLSKVAGLISMITIEFRMLFLTATTGFKQLAVLTSGIITGNFTEALSKSSAMGKEWSSQMDILTKKLGAVGVSFFGMGEEVKTATDKASGSAGEWSRITGKAADDALKNYQDYANKHKTATRQHQDAVMEEAKLFYAAQLAEAAKFSDKMVQLEVLSQMKKGVAVSVNLSPAEKEATLAALALKEQAVAASAASAALDKLRKSRVEVAAVSSKATAEAKAAEDSYTASLRDSYVELSKGNAAMEAEIAAIGKTKEELDKATIASIDNTIAQKDREATSKSGLKGYEDQVLLLREEIRLLEQRKTLIGQKATAVAADEAAKARTKAEQDAVAAQKKAYEDLWKSVDNFAHDAFMNITDKGKNAFAEIGKAIKKSILEMLYQMTVQKWILNISASGTGSAGGGVASAVGSAASGGSGIGSWLSAGQSLWSAFSGGMASGLGGLAVSAGEMLGSTALMEFGAGMSGLAGAGVTGGAAGLGASVGAALPWLTVGALVLPSLFDAAFGKSKGPSGPTTMRGSFSDQGFGASSVTPWYQSGGWFSASGSGEYVNALPTATVDAFTAAVGATKATFESLAVAAGVSTASLTGWSFSFDRVVNDQAQAAALVNDMADSMGTRLIPQLVDFRREGESLADTAVRLRDAFIATDGILQLTGGTFGGVGLASAAARDNLVTLMGGIQQLSGTMQSYYANFFTDAERHANDMRTLGDRFAALGVAMPTTAAGFRALVEAQDLSTAAGRQTFASLMSLNGAFAALIPNAEAAAQATRDATAALAAQAASDSASFQKAADAMRAFVTSVQDLQRSLWAGTQAPASSSTRLDMARSAFFSTNTAAAAGNAAAQSALSGVATTFLDVARTQSGSLTEYAREFGAVQSALSDTVSRTENALATATSLFDLNAVINFTTNATGIPEDLRNLLTAQSLEYLALVNAQMAATTDPAMRRVIADGAGNYAATVTAILGEVDPAARALAITASGNYVATVTAAMGAADDASRKLALTAAGDYLTTVRAALATDATTTSLQAFLAAGASATVTVNGSMVFDPNSPVVTALGGVSTTLDSLLVVARDSLAAARRPAVEQGIERLTADIRGAVGSGYDATRLTSTTNTATGVTSLRYAGQYATLSGTVGAAGGVSAVSSSSTAAQTAAQSAAAAAAAQEQQAAATAAQQEAARRAGLVATREAAIAAANAEISAAQDRVDALRDSNSRAYGRLSAASALAAAQDHLANAQALPTFATGGFHTGGLRIVGENGPELEYTGPSRIFSNGDTKAMLSNADVVAAINQLREEIRAGQVAISGGVQKTAKILDRWDGNGMPDLREAA